MKKFSRFTHVFQRNDVVALYYAINHKVVYLSSQLFKMLCQFLKDSNTVSRNSQEIVQKLVKRLTTESLLVNSDDDEEEKIERLRKIFYQPGIYILYLLLTDSCNLGCTYCFMERPSGQRPKPTLMSFSTVQKALDLYIKCLKKIDNKVLDAKTKMINFYGGEPLINKGVFLQALQYIEILRRQGKLPRDIRLSLNTNGTLVDREIALALKKYNVEVAVSIDGPRQYHDTNRKYWRSTKGSFTEAVHAFQLLKKLDVNVGVSCTVPEQNVDALPGIFKWFVEELGVKAIGFNPLLESRTFKVKDPLYPQKVSEKMIECYKIARRVGVYEDRMMRKVKAFVGQYFYDRDCSAIGRQIVVGPNEEVGTCPAFYGSGKYFVKPKEGLENFDPYSHPYWREWSKRLTINFSKCLDCPALGICGGGCPYNAWVRHGSIWKIDDFFCSHSLKTLEWLIWDLYDQSLLCEGKLQPSATE